MPSHVLMLSLDRTLTERGDGSGDTRKRHIAYAAELERQAPGSKLVILAPAGEKAVNEWLSPSCLIVPYPEHPRWQRAWFLQRAGFGQSSEHTFSLITSQSAFDDGWAGRRLARRLGTRFIPQIRGDIFSSGWQRQRWPLNMLATRAALSILRRADAIQVVSITLRDELVRRGFDERRIFVIPSIITFTPFTFPTPAERASFRTDAGVPADAPLIFYAGELAEHKNIELLLAAMTDVLSSSPAVMVLAGQGPDRSLVEDWQRQHRPLANRVKLLGQISYELMRRWYAASDVFVLASRYEGLPRVLREAAASGLPIITTDVSGAREIVQDDQSGFIVPSNDRPALTAAVQRLVADADLRRRFGERGREHEQTTFSSKALITERIRRWLTPTPA